MKVLLATLNAKYIHSSLALRYLKASCLNAFAEDDACREDSKIKIELKEYSINNHLPDILADIYPSQPDVVALAAYIWNIEATLKLSSLLKKTLPNAKIALGGPEVCAGFSFDGNYVDYVVLGEGEKTFVSFLAALKNNTTCHNIPGLLSRMETAAQTAAPRTVAPQIVYDLDTIPFPYEETDMNALRDKIIYYESSRGCPFSCQYCLSGISGSVRFFSLERVLADLSFFIKHDVAQVKFVDRTFNAAKKHYLPILKFLAGQNCRTNFHFEAAAGLWDEEGLAILETAPPGRFQLEIGVQSTHPPTLHAVSRHNDFAAIAKSVRRIGATGNIHLHLDLIAGLPYEGIGQFAKSFNDVYSLAPDMLQLGFLKLLKGSALRENAQKYGYVFTDDAPYEVLANNYLSYGEIRQLKILEKVFNLIYNSSRFRCTLKWLTAKDVSAFAFYKTLAVFWERQGFELAAHSPVALYQFIADFCQVHRPESYQTSLEFLKFDYLLSQKWANRPDFLRFNDSATEAADPAGQKWTAKKNSFWRNPSLTRHYLPDFTFTTWRDVKKNYHIEVFRKNIPGFIRHKEVLADTLSAVLFYSGTDGKINFQTIAARHFI